MTKIPDDNNFALGCDVAYGRVHEFPTKVEELDEEKKSLKWFNLIFLLHFI